MTMETLASTWLSSYFLWTFYTISRNIAGVLFGWLAGHEDVQELSSKGPQGLNVVVKVWMYPSLRYSPITSKSFLKRKGNTPLHCIVILGHQRNLTCEIGKITLISDHGETYHNLITMIMIMFIMMIMMKSDKWCKVISDNWEKLQLIERDKWWKVTNDE